MSEATAMQEAEELAAISEHRPQPSEFAFRDYLTHEPPEI